MDTLVEKAAQPEQTLALRSIIGLRVLTKTGYDMGQVAQVHLAADKYNFEGITVNRSLLGKPLYICKSYVERITPDAVLLDIEPAVLYVGRKMVSMDGKVFGSITAVQRVEQTNDIDSFTVRHGFFAKTTIPISEVKQLGETVLLKKEYDELKAHYGTKTA